VYNILTQNIVSRFLLSKLVRLTAIPAINSHHFNRDIEALTIQIATPETIASLSSEEKQRAVIIVPDVFTQFFDAGVVADVFRLLTELGYKPLFAPFVRNGKPQQVLGFLEEFNHVSEKTSAQLNTLAASGIPLVGIESSMSLIYRAEYREVEDNTLKANVLLLQEWLATQSDTLKQQREKFSGTAVRLLPHCTEASADHQLMTEWKTGFDSLGFELTIATVGCCGMAGTYGHETEHQEISKKIYDLSWRGIVENNDNNPILVASGYSCRCQVERFSGKRLMHPAQVLLNHIKSL